MQATMRGFWLLQQSYTACKMFFRQVTYLYSLVRLANSLNRASISNPVLNFVSSQIKWNIPDKGSTIATLLTLFLAMTSLMTQTHTFLTASHRPSSFPKAQLKILAETVSTERFFIEASWLRQKEWQRIYRNLEFLIHFRTVGSLPTQRRDSSMLCLLSPAS